MLKYEISLGIFHSASRDFIALMPLDDNFEVKWKIFQPFRFNYRVQSTHANTRHKRSIWAYESSEWDSSRLLFFVRDVFRFTVAVFFFVVVDLQSVFAM